MGDKISDYEYSMSKEEYDEKLLSRIGKELQRALKKNAVKISLRTNLVHPFDCEIRVRKIMGKLPIIVVGYYPYYTDRDYGDFEFRQFPETVKPFFDLIIADSPPKMKKTVDATNYLLMQYQTIMDCWLPDVSSKTTMDEIRANNFLQRYGIAKSDWDQVEAGEKKVFGNINLSTQLSVLKKGYF